MVRTTVHTCKDCDKTYKSYQSLCNHRTKKHKVYNIDQGKHEVNINDDKGKHMVNIEEQSTLHNIEADKTFNCRKCDKIYKYKQSRWFHEKKCNEIIIQNQNAISEVNTNIETQNNIQTQNNNTNNGTINNTTNNITINNYGDEDKSYISEEFMLRIISNIIKNDDKITEVIPHLIRNIHFNPNHKNNNNMKINNIKSLTAKIYKNKKWEYVDKKQILNETHEKGVKFTENWAEEHKEKVPNNAKDKIKDYKQIHSKQYHNKKKILEEITKLAYIYYQNYMKDEPVLDV